MFVLWLLKAMSVKLACLYKYTHTLTHICTHILLSTSKCVHMCYRTGFTIALEAQWGCLYTTP